MFGVNKRQLRCLIFKCMQQLHFSPAKMPAKRKRSNKTSSIHTENDDVSSFHRFSPEEILVLRKELLSWYDVHGRDLPWRRLAKSTEEASQRAYLVWVSEIMCQQTQVATVISYYQKWIEKWPKLEDLANASLEEVNEMWAGLGYYSRGKRLQEGAKKVVEEFGGVMPSTADLLMKQLPGVGRYTAGAIASISFNQPTGVVDGNVIRVMSRLRCIGADSTNQNTMDAIWNLANACVDEERPGDFNQSVMELGATVCTPKSPSCSKCPVQHLCQAYRENEHNKQMAATKLGSVDQDKSNLLDIEECGTTDCKLCLGPEDSWDLSLGVTNYPRKGKKKAPRENTCTTCILQRKGKTATEYLIVKRPETGLLAGLWEFPSLDMSCQENGQSSVLQSIGVADCDVKKKESVGEVVHIFSHIHQTYLVEAAMLVDEASESISMDAEREFKWVTREQFLESAVSTAMKKVFKLFENNGDKKSTKKKVSTPAKNQPTLAKFFKASPQC